MGPACWTASTTGRRAPSTSTCVHGSHVVGLVDIDVQPGPDYDVYVVPGSDRDELADAVRIDDLRGNQGTQFYEVGAETDSKPARGRCSSGARPSRAMSWVWRLREEWEHEDEAHEGGDGAGGAPQDGGDPESEQRDHREVEAGAEDRSQHVRITQRYADVLALQDG